MELFDLQATIETKQAVDDIQSGSTAMTNNETIAGGGIVYINSVINSDGFISVTTPSPGVAEVSKGTGWGTLALKNFTVADLAAIGALPVSNPPTQAEVTQIATQLTTAWNKIQEILDALQ